MTGSLAQSYFIFDSVNYSIGRKIYYKVSNYVEENSTEKDEKELAELMGNDDNVDKILTD